MELGTPQLAVTGLGAVSPFGTDIAALLNGLASGQAAVKEVEPTGLPGRRLPVIHCDSFDATQFLPAMKVRRWDPCSRFAAVSAKLALESAGLSMPGGPRIGILAGTWSAGATPLADLVGTIFKESPEAAQPMLFPFTVANAPASQTAIELGLKGPIATLSHRVAVFADSLLYASILLADDRADAIVILATDEVNPTYLRAWDELRIVAAPGREGIVLGEGSYAVVVELPKKAYARRAQIRSIVGGIGFRHDRVAQHDYPQDSAVVAGADRDALARAGRRTNEVDFVILADDGRRAAAEVERRALDDVFGDAIPYTARYKAALGEGGGPSAGQAVVAMAAVETTRLPPDRGGALAGSEAAPPTDPKLGLVHFLGAGGVAFSLAIEAAQEGMDTATLTADRVGS